MPAGAPFQRVGTQTELPGRAHQRGLEHIAQVVLGLRWPILVVRRGAHGGASGVSLSTWRSCGNAHIQTSITMIAPTPPISAEGTAPSQAATVPARNSPSEPEEPVNMELTAITRPSMS